MALACSAGSCAPYSIPLPNNPHSCRTFGPWDEPQASGGEIAPATGAVDAAVVLYQRSLRRPYLPGDSCPFEPSCSEFARSALAKYPELVAILLIVDRLVVRENSFAPLYHPSVEIEGATYLYDPVP